MGGFSLYHIELPEGHGQKATIVEQASTLVHGMYAAGLI